MTDLHDPGRPSLYKKDVRPASDHISDTQRQTLIHKMIFVFAVLAASQTEACIQLPPLITPRPCPMDTRTCVDTGETNVLDRRVVSGPRPFNCSKKYFIKKLGNP